MYTSNSWSNRLLAFLSRIAGSNQNELNMLRKQLHCMVKATKLDYTVILAMFPAGCKLSEFK